MGPVLGQLCGGVSGLPFELFRIAWSSRVRDHRGDDCRRSVQYSPSASSASVANTRSEAVKSTRVECACTTTAGTSAATRTRYIGWNSTNITESHSQERNAET